VLFSDVHQEFNSVWLDDFLHDGAGSAESHILRLCKAEGNFNGDDGPVFSPIHNGIDGRNTANKDD